MNSLNRRIGFVGTALALAGAILYWLALSGTLSSFPPHETVLSSIEMEAKLFFASSLALLYWRTTGDRWLSRLPAAFCLGMVAFFISGWLLNAAVWLVPQGTKMDATVAITKIKQMDRRDSTPFQTLVSMKDSLIDVRSSDIDNAYRSFLSSHLEKELSSNREKLLAAYRQVGEFMLPYWNHYASLESSGSRKKWATSVQMQKAIWNTREINEYCNTSLGAPGMAQISPCDFQLWQGDDQFISDISRRQATEIKKATCGNGCPLLEDDVLDKSFKLMWLPFMAWGVVHFAIILYSLGLLLQLVRGGVTGWVKPSNQIASG